MTIPTRAQPPTAAGTAEEQRRDEIREYVRQLRAFHIHVRVCAVAVVVSFIVNLAINVAAGITGDLWAWWSAWVLLGCGLGLTVHGAVLLMSRSQQFGATWEERRIDEILAAEQT